MAQVVFVLLSYTLRQWQLWRTQKEALAGCHPHEVQRQLNLNHQVVVIYLALACVQLPLGTFTREGLELEPATALAKIQRLEQSFLHPLENPRPP